MSSDCLKIVHTADIHLDQRQYGFQERWYDMCRAFDRAVTFCIDQKVDAFILAGDVFNNPRPSKESLLFYKTMVRKLADAGVWLITMDGNHDLSDSGWQQLCDAPKPDVSGIPRVYSVRRWGLQVDVAAFPYMRGKQVQGAVKEWADAGNKANIVVLHQMVEGLVPPVCPSEVVPSEILPYLKAAGTKYVALGHVHKANEVTLDDILFAYSGSLEWTEHGEDHDKALVLMEWRRSAGVMAFSRTLVEAPVRPSVDIAIETYEDLDGLAEKLKPMVSSEAPLLFIRYNTQLSDIADRIDQIVDHRFMYQAIPDGILVAPNLWDRTAQVMTLNEIVTKSFDPKSDEHSLVTSLLAVTDLGQVAGIVNAFLASKGLQLKVK